MLIRVFAKELVSCYIIYNMKPQSSASSGKYDDIIYLDRPASPRSKMPRAKRAAQFAPFAALSGYGEIISELERSVDAEIELDEAGKAELDAKIAEILQTAPSREITVTYFEPDLRKKGGKYKDYKGVINKINTASRYILFADGTRINLDRIIDLQ